MLRLELVKTTKFDSKVGSSAAEDISHHRHQCQPPWRHRNITTKQNRLRLHSTATMADFTALIAMLPQRWYTIVLYCLTINH